MRVRRKSPAASRVTFSCSSVKANSDVRSMAIEVELALLNMDLSHVDVEVADRVGPELPLVRLAASDLGQAGSAARNR